MKELRIRFWEKVQKTDSCWNWVGYVGKDGYGRFHPNARKTISTHRMAWIIGKGKIPLGMCICHACDNRKCVNLSHLFLGTHSENTIDMYRKGRNSRKDGEFNGRAKLNWNLSRSIKYLFPNIGTSQLGRNFGVSHTIIGLIRKNQIWKENPI